jgi:hypothetical protein
MSKDLSKHLSDLKPLLPRGYQKKIAKNISIFEEWEIKKAFNGQLKDREKLLKILSEAQKLATITTLENKRATQNTRKILIEATKL